MQIKSIRKIKNLYGKRVLLRVDFNVSINNGVIKDDYKIEANLLTIKFLRQQGCKIVIISHLDDKQSLKPVAIHLNNLLKKHFNPQDKNQAFVKFINKFTGFDTAEKIGNMREGDIAMLENLFFNENEEKNDNSFAKDLAQLADIYVNNAFCLCNKKYASIAAIQKHLPSFGGLLLEREIYSLSRILNPERPFAIIMGGTQAETKLPLIFKFYENADNILLGGAVANTFLKMLDFKIGKSLIGKNKVNNIQMVKKKVSNPHKRKIISPLDVVISCDDDKENSLPKSNNTIQRQQEYKVMLKNIKKVKANDNILDIGPETIALYSGIIKQAKTLFWSGPLGKFEDSRFKHGTMAIARLIASRSTGPAFGVAGGDHTIQALEQTGIRDYMDWIYTCNDATLDFLNKKEMPGLKLINN